MANYLVAVSGGIDSSVLLDMLVKDGVHGLTVAHFDHGIRPDSADDARFVKGLAGKYGLPFVMRREELGAQASEELARTRRYVFLREEAKKRGAIIATAHHADDIIETVAINLVRGTGWRGLAVLDTPGVTRPLLHLNKEKIRAYARAQRLEWVEDSTNATEAYLRNRLRRKITAQLPEKNKQELLGLWRRQVALKRGVDATLEAYVNESGEYGRYFLIQIDPMVACELLRAMVIARTAISPTRPQLARALLAVKTARAGTTFEVAKGVKLRFSSGGFIVETP